MIVRAKRLGWDETLTAEQEYDLDPYTADDDELEGELVEIDAPAVEGFPGVKVTLVDGQEADPKTVVAENAFCPTGEGGGVDPSCSPNAKDAMAAEILEWMPNHKPTDSQLNAFTEVQKALGRAKVNYVTMHYVNNVPDMVVAFGRPRGINAAAKEVLYDMAIAGGYRVRFESNLVVVSVQESPRETPSFDTRPNETLPEDFYANAFCPTGEGGGVDPSCGRSVGKFSEIKAKADKLTKDDSSAEVEEELTEMLSELSSKEVVALAKQVQPWKVKNRKDAEARILRKLLERKRAQESIQF